MEKNDFNIDYDPRQEQDLSPDPYADGGVDDDLDLEELKRLTSDGFEYDPSGDSYDENADYDMSQADDPSLYEDAFVDENMDDPSGYDR